MKRPSKPAARKLLLGIAAFIVVLGMIIGNVPTSWVPPLAIAFVVTAFAALFAMRWLIDNSDEDDF